MDGHYKTIIVDYSKILVVDVKDVAAIYTDEKKSLPEIADKFGLSLNTVRRHLVEHGVKMRTPKEGAQIAGRKRVRARIKKKWPWALRAK